MYTVIGPVATRTSRVLWALEELGVAYDRQDAPPRSEAVTRINPSGKVPVLLTEDEAIVDSTAILSFLADRHGALTFPAGSIERARQDAAMHTALDEFDACLWVAARHSFILPEEKRLPAIKDVLKWEFGVAEQRFGARLGDGPYLMGETFTIADIVAGHCLAWAGRAGFPVETAAATAYRDRLFARPAFQAVEALRSA